VNALVRIKKPAKVMGAIMAITEGQEDIRVGKGTCVISWSKTGKEELICALGTVMDLIEYGDKYVSPREWRKTNSGK